MNWWKNLVGQHLSFLNKQPTILETLIGFPDATTGYLDPELCDDGMHNTSIYALVPHGGSCFLKQGSTNNKVAISSGVVMQMTDAFQDPGGGEGTLLAFRIDDPVQFQFTIANGDVSNPRVDLLQIQINTDTNQVPTLTLLVKQGTPAATPAYPAPDANYCVIGAVVVGTSYVGAAGIKFEDTAGAVAVLHDQRMPFSVKMHTVWPNEYDYVSGEFTQAFLGRSAPLTAAASGARDVTMVLGEPGTIGRLIAVAVGTDAPSAPAGSHITKRQFANSAGSLSNTTTILNAGPTISGSALYDTLFKYVPGSTSSPAAGPAVSSNGNGMGAPIWTNGKRAVTEPFAGGSPVAQSYVQLFIDACPTGMVIGPTTFWVAGGL